jgi:zinc transporter 1/2/3
LLRHGVCYAATARPAPLPLTLQGIILSTSFIHLLYEGLITFADPCIRETTYDPIAPAIALAGAYVTFILDFVGGRQRIASVKRQMQALPLGLSSGSAESGEAGVRESASASASATDVVRRDDKNAAAVPRPGHAHAHAHDSQDRVLAAMAQGGCGDEHDAVFRAEQGWQVLLLEAGIIFHS